jgi:hypothetical protein
MTADLDKAIEVLLKAKEGKKDEKPHEEEKAKETAPRKIKGMKAQYEIIEIKDCFNLHKTEEYTLADRKYEKERFLIKRGLSDRIHKRIRFLVVHKTPAKEGEKPIAVTLSDPVDINSRLLYTVKTSKTLRKALVSLFSKPFSFGGFGGKKILFLAIIVAVCVAGYFIYTGQLNLGGIFGGTPKS